MSKLPTTVGGRTIVPAKYRKDAIDVLCSKLLEGKTIEDACKIPEMPPATAVRKWLMRDKALRDKFVEIQRVIVLEEGLKILAIADGEDSEDTARDRLRVGARQWFLTKLDQENYGSKFTHKHEAGGSFGSLIAAAMDVGHKLPKGDTYDAEYTDITPEEPGVEPGEPGLRSFTESLGAMGRESRRKPAVKRMVAIEQSVLHPGGDRTED